MTAPAAAPAIARPAATAGHTPAPTARRGSPGEHRSTTTVKPRLVSVIAADGTRLAVSDTRPPRPQHTMVFLHGLCLDHTSWAQHADRITRRFAGVRVISYDHRGHGQSAHAAIGSYTIDQLADDFAAVLRQLHVTSPLTVIGHSMGGMAVLAYLDPPPVQRPVDPTSLIFVATAAGKLTCRGLGRLLTIPGGIPTLAHLVDHIPDHLLRELLKPVCVTLARTRDQLPSATLAAVILSALTSTSPKTAVGFLPALRTYDHYPALHGIRAAHTTVISGGADPLTPPAHGRDLAANIPGAVHITACRAGHMLAQQAPGVIDDALRAAVTRHTPAAAAHPLACAAGGLSGGDP